MTQPLYQAIRGMSDTLPEVTPYWRAVESSCHLAASACGYREVRFPVVECTDLFQRTLGEETDAVFKEMYTFEDRNGDLLSLRPEGTAVCVRLAIEHGLIYKQLQRFWYLGPMFRYEKPQKGRYRQFHQFGVEAFGMQDPAIDAEVIALSYRLWQQLGLASCVRLELNSLGDVRARSEYRQALVHYFTQHRHCLDEDSRRRLNRNPLRILDSKNREIQDLIHGAPVLSDYLSSASHQHFAQLQSHLHALKVPFVLNPYLVRGLDYYGSTVFEWITDALGAQGTVCAGGRYDHLVEELGGYPTPAVGCSVGLERVVLLLQETARHRDVPDVYFIVLGEAARQKGLVWSTHWRAEIPRLKMAMDLSSSSVKSQFKRADKSGATWAFVMGEDEVTAEKVSIKNLRQKTEQNVLPLQAVSSFLREVLL